jgi:hypothetical protein
MGLPYAFRMVAAEMREQKKGARRPLGDSLGTGLGRQKVETGDWDLGVQEEADPAARICL